MSMGLRLAVLRAAAAPLLFSTRKFYLIKSGLSIIMNEIIYTITARSNQVWKYEPMEML